jgi:hypothetical protein
MNCRTWRSEISLDLRHKVFAAIYSLRERCPAGVNQDDWNLAVGEVVDGYLAMYGDLGETEDARFAALLDEVEAVLRQAVEPESLLRLWDRVYGHADRDHKANGLPYRGRLVDCLEKCGMRRS